MKFVFDVATKSISEDRGFESIDDWNVENGVVRIPVLNVVFTDINKEITDGTLRKLTGESLREVDFNIYVNKTIKETKFEASAEMHIVTNFNVYVLEFDRKELASLSIPFLLMGIKTCSVKDARDTRHLHQWLLSILPIINSKLKENLEFGKAHHLTALCENLVNELLPSNRLTSTKSYWAKSDMFIYTTKERSLSYIDGIYDYTVDIWDVKENEFKLYIERNILEQRMDKLEVTKTLLLITLDALGIDFFLSERIGELKEMEMDDVDFSNSASVLEYTEKVFKEINKNGVTGCLVEFHPVMKQYTLNSYNSEISDVHKQPGYVSEMYIPKIIRHSSYGINPTCESLIFGYGYATSNPSIDPSIEAEYEINEDYQTIEQTTEYENIEEDVVTTDESTADNGQDLQTVLTNFILEKYNNKRYWDVRVIRNYIIDTGRKNISDEEKEFIKVNSPKVYKEFFGED